MNREHILQQPVMDSASAINGEAAYFPAGADLPSDKWPIAPDRRRSFGIRVIGARIFLHRRAVIGDEPEGPPKRREGCGSSLLRKVVETEPSAAVRPVNLLLLLQLHWSLRVIWTAFFSFLNSLFVL